MDQEAHGNSIDSENRAFTGDYSDLVLNGTAFVNTMAIDHKIFSSVPMFLFGHAMGATTVLQMALSRLVRPPIKGIILSSPAFKTHQEPNSVMYNFYSLAIKVPGLGGVVGNSDRAKIDVEHLTSLKDIQKMFQLQNARFFDVNGYLGKAIIDMGHDCFERCLEFSQPMLILQGSNDQVTDTKATHDFNRKLKVKKTYLEFSGKHDLLHDVNVIEVEETILRWIKKQMGINSKLEDQIVQLKQENQVLKECIDTLRVENDILRSSKKNGEGVNVQELLDQISHLKKLLGEKSIQQFVVSPRSEPETKVKFTDPEYKSPLGDDKDPFAHLHKMQLAKLSSLDIDSIEKAIEQGEINGEIQKLYK